MIKNILDKINLEELTQEEQAFVTRVLTREQEKEEKKAKVKAEKMVQNQEIIDAMNELLDKQGQFTASEVFDALDGKYTIQRVSYVARELAPVKSIDNPLYAVKLYERA